MMDELRSGRVESSPSAYGKTKYRSGRSIAMLRCSSRFAPSGHDRCERLGFPAYRLQQRCDLLHGLGIAAEQGNELPNGATTRI